MHTTVKSRLETVSSPVSNMESFPGSHDNPAKLNAPEFRKENKA